MLSIKNIKAAFADELLRINNKVVDTTTTDVVVEEQTQARRGNTTTSSKQMRVIVLEAISKLSDELMGFKSDAFTRRGDVGEVVVEQATAMQDNPAAARNFVNKQKRFQKTLSRLSCLICGGVSRGGKPKPLNGSSSTMELLEETGSCSSRKKQVSSTPSNSLDGSKQKRLISPTGVDEEFDAEFGTEFDAEFDANPDQILHPHQFQAPFDAAACEWNATVLQYELGEETVPQDIVCGQVEEEEELADLEDDCESIMDEVEHLLWTKSPQKAGYYSGQVISSGSVPHGRGVLEFFESGDLYEGLFKNGYMHDSYGGYKWQSGALYVGGFSEGLKHGHGEHYVDGNLRYVGCFDQGIPHGYGEGYRADGSLYHKGQWDRGMPAHAMLDTIEPTSFIDDDSQVSELIRVACDLSVTSSVEDDPRISQVSELIRAACDLSVTFSVEDDPRISQVSELIRAACDLSVTSSVEDDPRISQYELCRHTLDGADDGDSSVDSSDTESCFSELTTDEALNSEIDLVATNSNTKKRREKSMYETEKPPPSLVQPRSPLSEHTSLRSHDLAVFQATRILDGRTEKETRGSQPSSVYGSRAEI